jgi:hypothetical protein
MSTTVAMNTDAPATGSMGKYYTSKIGELREVSGVLVYDGGARLSGISE